MARNGSWAVSLHLLMLGALLACPASTQGQQRMQFTQYMFNGLVINPAYAGSDDALSLTFIQRSQWADVPNAPTTQTFSAHTLFGQKHIGLGLSVVSDRIGVHEDLSAQTNYAYHLKVGANARLSMGILAGFHKRTSDYASLVGTDHYDPQLLNPIISHTFVDFGAGLYFRNERLRLGFSAPELIPATYAFNDSVSIRMSKTNFFFLAAYRLRVAPSLEVEPGFLVKYLPGLPVSFDVNINFIFQEVLTAGISYRKRESLDVLLRAQATGQLQFGYAFDYPIGEVSRLSNGSHELMINYIFQYKRKRVMSPR